MKESDFADIFFKAAQSALIGSNYIPKKKANILYELFFNNNLELQPKEFDHPTRGRSAFETDISIFENISNKTSGLYPRVIIELKTTITTHDIITYSEKAQRHKMIYPGLRYGIVASNISKISTKFFIHNTHLDFVVAAKNFLDEGRLDALVDKLINEEITLSNKMEGLLMKNQDCCWFQVGINTNTFQDIK